MLKEIGEENGYSRVWCGDIYGLCLSCPKPYPLSFVYPKIWLVLLGRALSVGDKAITRMLVPTPSSQLGILTSLRSVMEQGDKRMTRPMAIHVGGKHLHVGSLAISQRSIDSQLGGRIRMIRLVWIVEFVWWMLNTSVGRNWSNNKQPWRWRLSNITPVRCPSRWFSVLPRLRQMGKSREKIVWMDSGTFI